MFKTKENIQIQDIELPIQAKPLNLLWMEPGTFKMGVPEGEQLEQDYTPYSKQFEAEITKGFWMGQYLVTQAHWLTFIESHKFKKYESKINYPIYGINWLEAMKFCKQLNQVYKSQLPDSYHFSLPTELHWEYAWFIGKNNDSSDKISNEIIEVGKGEANSVGFYDLIENVSEWCFDVTTYYPEQTGIDWIGNQEDFWFDEAGKHRSERQVNCGQGRVYTKFDFGGWEREDGFHPRPVGFRVCLRPITEWDLNDPILKKYNINMIG